MKPLFKATAVVFIFMLGCYFYDQKFPDYEKIADKITERTARQLKEQQNLFLVGTGGRMMNDIQMMSMSFFFYQLVELKMARELAVYAINEYLADINNNKEIRPYLHEYPFTAKNIEIRIWVHEPDGSYPPLDKIQAISSVNGILTYYLHVPEKYSYGAICKETYEEALQAISSTR